MMLVGMCYNLVLAVLFGLGRTSPGKRHQADAGVKTTRTVAEDTPGQYTDTLVPVNEPELSDEEKLYNYLFYRYNNAIRPVQKATEAVHVDVTFSLMQIHGLDEKTQVFRTYGWLIVEWSDRRLQWHVPDYNNMTEVVIQSSMLWTPELALINAVEWQFPDFQQYRAIIRHDGYIRWEPAGIFETSCKIDITFYPYDSQVCSLVFGTWTFTSLQVNLTNSTSEIILDDYNTSGEWRIKTHKVERLEFVYDCCPDIRFSKVKFTLSLARRHRFFTMNLVLPCAMLSSLTLVTFLSPPDQGEKISLGISILLSFSVFMLTLSENMPKTSESLPLFGIYTTFVMLMNTSSVMLTVLVLNLHHRNRSKPIPNWVRALVFQGLARILCMYSKEESYDRDYGVHPYPRYRYEDYRRDKQNWQKAKTGDGYSLANAAAQFRGNMKTTGLLLAGALPADKDQLRTSSTAENASRVNSHRGDDGKRLTVSNIASLLDENSKEYESLLKAEHFLNYELQEWKRLARIIDRLFFWMTLLALIGVSAGMIVLLLTSEL